MRLVHLHAAVHATPSTATLRRHTKAAANPPTLALRPSRTSASRSIPIIRSGEQFFLRLIFVSRDVQMKPDSLNQVGTLSKTHVRNQHPFGNYRDDLTAARVGFEPTERLHVQQFSRLPRSTTPAPRLQYDSVLHRQIADANSARGNRHTIEVLGQSYFLDAPRFSMHDHLTEPGEAAWQFRFRKTPFLTMHRGSFPHGNERRKASSSRSIVG